MIWNSRSVERRAGDLLSLVRVLVCLVIVLVATQTSAIEPYSARAGKIRAALLCTFGKFSTWPTEMTSQTQFSVCILGEDPFGQAFVKLNKKKIRGKPLTIRRLQTVPDPKRCHILFVSPSESRRLPQILDQLNGTGTLIVGAENDFAARGGMVNFRQVGDRLAIEINPRATLRTGITIGARLLKLATIVSTQPTEP